LNHLSLSLSLSHSSNNDDDNNDEDDEKDDERDNTVQVDVNVKAVKEEMFAGIVYQWTLIKEHFSKMESFCLIFVCLYYLAVKVK